MILLFPVYLLTFNTINSLQSVRVSILIHWNFSLGLLTVTEIQERGRNRAKEMTTTKRLEGNNKKKRKRAIASYLSNIFFYFPLYYKASMLVLRHILYSCLCYTVLFSSDNSIFCLFSFPFLFFDLLNDFHPFVFWAFVFFSFIFPNSIYFGVFGVTSCILLTTIK